MVERSILNQILNVIGDPSQDIHLLGGYFNNVYEIRAEKPIVVKIFNSEVDHEEQIASEIDWTRYLYEHGINVAIPIFIKEESYIHRLNDNLFFIAYEKVKGNHVDIHSEIWNEELFNQWGRAMGNMHFLSKLSKGKYKRPEWYEHKIYQMDMSQFDPVIREKWENCLEVIKSMNPNNDTYGVIHGDLHHHNFLYDTGELTVIDFGDSEYNFYAYDIAIAIYHASQTVKDMDKRKRFANIFFKLFMEGYSVENSDVNKIVKEVDFFINYRHLYSFVYHTQFLDKANLNEQQLQYLEDMSRTIINQDSYLGIECFFESGSY
ncbi:phosphotransferase enzyme family protein [Paenibacillus glacialis]|uniref:Protein kinase domain-containing protein n=1 Tax=Paenibacillus glacialis TaxID=494026 RepID=A0A168K7C4_9BACL|nr:phosphotransferase [Paenibacillus glacialis]OAB41651.1 hypothetical protein PGLA_15335 [Paenibacillus glacialis]